MKFKSLLAVGMAAAVLASCAKDENKGTPGYEEGVPTYMNLTLKTQRANTRAHWGDLDATGPESVINEVTVYIIDRYGFLEETVVFDSGDLANNNTEATKTFTITTGDKTFYAAVNMNSELPAFPKGTTHIDAIKATDIAVTAMSDLVTIDDTAPYTGSNFWMTTFDDNNTATLIELTKPGDVPSTSNDVEIKIGRAMAKVGVYYNPTQTPDDGDLDASTVEYRAFNNPEAMKLFPYTDASGYRVTPYYNVATGNYFANTPYLGTGLDAGNEHEYISYIMENSNVNVSNEVSSFVMIKGVYEPDEVIDPDDGSIVTLAPGDDFWRISKVDLGGDRTGVWLEEYYSKDPDVSINPSSQVVLGADEASFKYTGGESYYGLWLMNSNESGTVNMYTVKRNQYWSVEITSVSGCGEPDEKGVIDGPDPDAETYMTATITVERWEDVERPGGI